MTLTASNLAVEPSSSEIAANGWDRLGWWFLAILVIGFGLLVGILAGGLFGLFTGIIPFGC